MKVEVYPYKSDRQMEYYSRRGSLSEFDLGLNDVDFDAEPYIGELEGWTEVTEKRTVEGHVEASMFGRGYRRLVDIDVKSMKAVVYMDGSLHKFDECQIKRIKE